MGNNEQFVRQTIAELPPTLQQLQTTFQTVRTAADELDPAFDALQPVAQRLPSGLRSLGQFSSEALPSFTALRKPLPSLERITVWETCEARCEYEGK